jgi:hypothetical protein
MRTPDMAGVVEEDDSRLVADGLISTHEFRARMNADVTDAVEGGITSESSLLNSTYELRTSLQDLETERILVVQRITGVQTLLRGAMPRALSVKGEAADVVVLVIEERQEQVSRLIVKTQLCSSLVLDKQPSTDNSSAVTPSPKRFDTALCVESRLSGLSSELEEEREIVLGAVLQLKSIIHQASETLEEKTLWHDLSALCDTFMALIGVIIHLVSHSIKHVQRRELWYHMAGDMAGAFDRWRLLWSLLGGWRAVSQVG